MMHTVLLIEDQADLASVLRLVASRNGFRVLLAASLAEAIQIWRTYHAEISILVTDNLLPDGSGWAFAGELKKERPDLKVILASGKPESGLSQEFLRLDKPFDLSNFVAMLTEAAKGSPSPS